MASKHFNQTCGQHTPASRSNSTAKVPGRGPVAVSGHNRVRRANTTGSGPRCACSSAGRGRSRWPDAGHGPVAPAAVRPAGDAAATGRRKGNGEPLCHQPGRRR
jgi:hypothetical protein